MTKGKFYRGILIGSHSPPLVPFFGPLIGENKRLNLELESVFFKIASLRSAHDDECKVM
jgi:hypothetical protein